MRFDRVISSDLMRARDTAHASGHAFEMDREWREFDVGAWEGLTREEVNERYPDEMERLKAGEDIPMGGGESYRTFSARIDRALHKLRSQLHPGSHALVVCHGGVIGTLIAGLLGLRGKSRWPLGRASNTSVSEVLLDGDHSELGVYNDASHLWPAMAWPHRDEDAACVALVADADPDVAQGEFAARYDARKAPSTGHPALFRLAEMSATTTHPAQLSGLVSAALAELHAEHAGHRVAVAMHSELIRTFVEDALWFDGSRQGRLRVPVAGSVSHVMLTAGRPALLDYAATHGESDGSNARTSE